MNKRRNDKDNLRKGLFIINNLKNKIIRLNEVTEKDFLFLSRTNNKFYNNLGQIILKIKKLNTLLSSPKTEQLILEFILQTNQFVDFIAKRLKLNTEIKEGLSELIPVLSYFEFFINNYKQSFYTLKLIDPGNFENHESWHEFNQVIDQPKNDLILNQFDEMENYCNEIVYKTQDFRTNTEKIINLVDTEISKLEKLRRFALNIGNDFTDLQNNLGALRLRTENITSNLEIIQKKSEPIIIHLQYHDIIRQKMEHIHSLFENLNVEMNEIKNNTKSNSKDTATQKYVENLSVLADLQVQQLFNINNEFQNATKNIVKGFFEISADMNNYFKQMNGKLFSESFDKFDEDVFEINNLNDFNKRKKSKYRNQKDILQKEYIKSHSINACESLSDLIVKLNKFNLEIIDKQKYNENSFINSETINMVNSQKRALHLNFEELSKINDIIKEKCSLYNQLLLEASKNIGCTEDNKISFELFFKNIKTTQKAFERINTLLFDVGNLMKVFLPLQSFKLDKIQYYKYYEHSIQEIISQLKDLLKLMHNNTKEKSASKNKVLGNIKKNYTVKSEYDIHNSLIGKTEEGSESENDDIELF